MRLTIAFLTLLLLASFTQAEWLFGPEGFEDGVIFDHSGYYPSYWFAPTYHSPMHLYSPGFESDSAVGSGAISWPDWWGNFVRTPVVDCSTADSVILSFRMLNTGFPDDFARFYIWVEPSGYAGTVTYDMNSPRDWELMTVDFTEYAAGESQVYFYLEANFGNDSYTHEVKFDDIGVSTTIMLSIENTRSKIPQDIALQLFPNPFNSSVTISTGASHAPPEMIEIYDLCGRLVYEMPAGLPSADPYEITWRPDESISGGVYLVRVTMEDRRTVSKRVVYLK